MHKGILSELRHQVK